MSGNKRYKGVMTGGMENEFVALKWFNYSGFEDHQLVYESPYMDFQYELQGYKKSTYGPIEGITKVANCFKPPESKERKLETLQHALFNWWEYGVVRLLRSYNKYYGLFVTKKQKQDQMNKIFKDYLGLKFEFGWCEPEVYKEFNAKNFRETFNLLVEHNKDKLKDISGLNDDEDIDTIKLNWPENDKIIPSRASELKAKAREAKRGRDGKAVRKSTQNKIVSVREDAVLQNTSQITLTFSLSTVPHLFEKYGDLGLPQIEQKVEKRKTQLANAKTFAERVLEGIKPIAAAAVDTEIRTQHKKDKILNGKCDKLKGFLCLLYLQLHGYGKDLTLDIEAKQDTVWKNKSAGEIRKLKKEFVEKELKTGFNFKDTIDHAAKYPKDYFAILLKTPLRRIYEQSLSQRDKAILVFSRANDLIGDNLITGDWVDKKGSLLSEYVFDNVSTAKDEPTRLEEEQKRDEAAEEMKKYVRYVLCPQEEIRKENNPVLKEKMERLDKLKIESKELNLEFFKKRKWKDGNEEQKKEYDLLKNKSAKLTEDQNKLKTEIANFIKLKQSELIRLFRKTHFEPNVGGEGTWGSPNQARQSLFGDGANVAIISPDKVKTKEIVIEGGVEKIKEVEKAVLRVAFEFRQIYFEDCDSFKKLYEKLYGMYKKSYEFYDKLTDEYEKRHPPKENLPSDSELKKEEALLLEPVSRTEKELLEETEIEEKKQMIIMIEPLEEEKSTKGDDKEIREKKKTETQSEQWKSFCPSCGVLCEEAVNKFCRRCHQRTSRIAKSYCPECKKVFDNEPRTRCPNYNKKCYSKLNAIERN
jgi:hypothetical protein